MRILLALHNESVRDTYESLTKIKGNTPLFPRNEYETKAIINAIESERPDRVVMDVNFGTPASQDCQPMI